MVPPTEARRGERVAVFEERLAGGAKTELPGRETDGAATDEKETESSKGAVDGFGNGSDGCPPEAYCHIEVLPPVNVSAQCASAICIGPKIEFVAIGLGEQ
jgi:hypothetical protein